MATIPERLTAVERDLLALKELNQGVLEAHAKENEMSFEAVQVRMDEMEQKIDSFGPVLHGISSNISILVEDKTGRDALTKAESNRRPKTPWDIFKAKMIESLATLISAGVIAGIIWLVVLYSKSGGHL